MTLNYVCVSDCVEDLLLWTSNVLNGMVPFAFTVVTVYSTELCGIRSDRKPWTHIQISRYFYCNACVAIRARPIVHHVFIGGGSRSRK